MKNAKVLFWIKNLVILTVFAMAGNFLLVPAATADTLWDNQIGMGTEPDEVGYAFGETADRNEVTDIRIVISKLIRVVLGFIGIIFLILIVYGGILWMTAAGSDDNVNKAKSLMFAGIIGLIITLSAFAIATFVTNKIYMATVSNPTTEN